MTKRFISIFLSVILLTSMFTGVVFAEATSTTLSLPSTGASWLLITDGRCIADGASTSGDRRSVLLFDFNDYEPYLYGADSISMTMETPFSTTYIYGMEFIALPDEKEQFINSGITYANSVSNGIYSSTGNVIAFRDYETDSSGKAIGYQGTITIPVNKANLIAAYEDGNNSTVALRMQSRGGGATTVKTAVKLTFNYDTDTIIDVIANELEWSDISEVASDAVTGNLNLPQTYGGCSVTWQSNNSAVNAQTGVVTQGREAQNITLTATLSHNGKSSSKEFNIIVPAVSLSEKTIYRSYITYVRGGTAGDGSNAADTPQTINETQVIAQGTTYYTYVCFDLSGLENVVDALAGAEISAYAGKWSAQRAYSHNYVLLSDECEQYINSALTYDSAKAFGIQSGGTVVAQKIVDEGYAGVQTTEVTNIEALKNAIVSNGIVAFRIDGTAGNSQSVFRDNTFNLILKYYENEVKTKDELFESKKNSLEWSHISTQPINEVKENLNLSSTFYGFDLSWKSNNEAVVASDGTVTRGNKTQKATLTATISHNGESVSKDFEITVPKIAYAYGDDLYEGTKTIKNASAFVLADGLYGKKASDKVYQLSSGVSGYLSLPATAGSDGVVEFSAYVPEGEGYITFEIGIVDGSQYGAQTLFKINNGGVYNNYSANKTLISEITDGWHTYSYVAPKGNGIDDTCELYIDGVLVSESTVARTTQGLRHIRVTAGGAASGEVSGYLDNIRTYNGSYNSSYDALAAVEYADGTGKNKNILLKSEITASEFKSKVVADEDVSVEVYATGAMSAPLSDEEIVKEGYIVVATSKNGTEIDRSYNYYVTERLKYEAKVKTLVNGNEAKTYNSGDSLRAEVEFSVYVSGESYDATMYAAQYKYGELVNLWTVPSAASITDKYTFICNFENITDMENSSIKIMLADDNLNPYCEAKTMRFNRQDSEATLFLLGDSIVQTYENFTYPIQGWGFYIGDYLNKNIKVENRATSGWTTDHYLYPEERGVIGTANEYKTWENIKSELKAGDYVMISLGINDAGSGAVSEAKYRRNIEKIYNDASVKGATVILSTPTIQGKVWNNQSAGFGLGGYVSRGAICEMIAASNNSVCLPLGAELVKIYNAMATKYLEENAGATRADANNYVGNYFHIYAASSSNPPAGWSDFGTSDKDDSMHYNTTGANVVAEVIARLILESDSSLADYVVIQNN